MSLGGVCLTRHDNTSKPSSPPQEAVSVIVSDPDGVGGDGRVNMRPPDEARRTIRRCPFLGLEVCCISVDSIVCARLSYSLFLVPLPTYRA